ncbi:BQ2448_1739 [Microbotryum intermedium]|uniref:BQ2448_1739 protein n=1 Tax=Microbotryum intermedium TaxID=269621 RepID=A0A238FAW3_9BASI|nr:BQ2448_1739 [Microbotryum intermedium]
MFPQARTRQKFKSAILCGLSLHFPFETSRQELAGIEGVTGVSRVKLRYQQDILHSPASPSEKLQTRASTTGTQRERAFSPHTMTGVDILHQKGLSGDRSIRICFIDSGEYFSWLRCSFLSKELNEGFSSTPGVDYFNPSLGNGCFGPKCKFGFGADFCGDDGNSPRAIPYTNCSAHGTHVAGIAGADYSEEYGFSGVAPGAMFGMYRVHSCTGVVPSDADLQAMLRAGDDRCDVLSMSFAKDMSWDQDDLDDPNRPVMSKLEARGIFLVASSGNDASQGLMFPKTPADLPGVLSTGSMNPLVFPIGYELSFDHGAYPSMRYLSFRPVNHTNTFDIYFHSTRGHGDTSCAPLPKNGRRFDASVVVVREGVCSEAAISWYIAHGARVVIEFQSSSVPTYVSKGVAYNNQDFAGLDWLLRFSEADALTLLDRYKAQNGILRVNFRSSAPLPQSRLVDSQDGGIISAFSEYGPTATLDNLAAHLVGPGSSILSTVPLRFGGYGVHSGTSMVTPLVAGIAGLLLSHRKAERLTPAQLRSLLITTSQPVPSGHGEESSLTTVFQQGGGLVSAVRAFNAKTFVEPYQIAVYDAPRHITEHVITLTNMNGAPVTYSFDSIASQTLAMYNKSATSEIIPSTSPPVIHGSARVTFEPRQLTIAAGRTATFIVYIQQPVFNSKNLPRIPAYGGWIIINAQGDPVDTYHVPYFGVGADLSTVPILDTTSSFAASKYNFPALKYPFLVAGNGNDSSSYPNVPHDRILLDMNKVTSLSRQQGVNIVYRMAMSSARVYFDVVPAHISQPIRWSSEPHGATNTSERPSSKQFSSIAKGNWVWFGGVTRNSDLSAIIPSVDYQVGVFHGPLGSDIDATSSNSKLAAHVPARILIRRVVSSAPIRGLALRLSKAVDDYSEASYEMWLSPPFMFID